MYRLLISACVALLIGRSVALAAQGRTHYFVPRGEPVVSRSDADAVYTTVADAYAEYTHILQELRPSNVRASMASLRSLRSTLSGVRPFFSKDIASAAGQAAKAYFAHKARACVESEKALPDARLLEIDEVMADNPRLAALREDVYGLFVEFFKCVITDYSKSKSNLLQ